MKKIIGSVALVALTYTSMNAIAAPAAIVSNERIAVADCALLAEDVRITLSSSVLAARNCVVANNAILMATCHTSGRKASRTVEVPCDADDDSPAPACDGTGGTGGTGATVNRVTNTGAAIFVGSTAGGQLGPAALDGSECVAGSLSAKVPDPS